jgi:L-ascorbate metabolism protein UlaG (beta-lactamase superfamily)
LPVSILLLKYPIKPLEIMQGLGYNYLMVISWFGLSSFKISSGNLTIVTDPFGKASGLTAPRGATDLVVISNSGNELYNNTQSLGDDKTFVIDSPGEFDVKGLFVRGIPAHGGAIYSIRMEDMRLGFLGALKQKELTDSELEDLGEIDILFVPVGGESVCDAEEAVTIVNQIEPRYVIPMHYAQTGLKLKLDKVDQFLKEMGAAKVEPLEKFTLKKSNLEGDTTEVVVLTAQR